MNEFSEGVFPAILDIVAGPVQDRDAANGIRHLMVDSYVADVTPGFDTNPDRDLLPNGDLDQDSRPGMFFGAPIQFIHDALIAPFPGDPTSPADTGAGKALAANAGANTFTRTDGGSFLLDGFRPGMVFFTFGFGNAANQGTFVIPDDPDPNNPLDDPVTATTVKVTRTLANETSSDAALVVRGDRGPLLDLMLIIQGSVDRQLAFLGGAPARTFEQILSEVAPLLGDGNPANDPSAATIAELVRAYLARWTADIDEGLRHWGEFGLATTMALFDSDTKRYWSNELAEHEGSDASRADDEAGVGLLDVVLAQLDDPNRDGQLDDSFLSNRVMPMLGLPRILGQFRSAMADFGGLLDDLVLPSVRFLFLPISALLGAAKAAVKDVIIEAIEERFGIDFELFEELTKLNNKMDLESVEVDGVRVPIFKAGDHEKLDRVHGRPGRPSVAARAAGHPGHPVPCGRDRRGRTTASSSTRPLFAAYADAVTLAKMLLLQELDPLGATTPGTGQLSKLMSDALTALPRRHPTRYDWSKLNLVGDSRRQRDDDDAAEAGRRRHLRPRTARRHERETRSPRPEPRTRHRRRRPVRRGLRRPGRRGKRRPRSTTAGYFVRARRADDPPLPHARGRARGRQRRSTCVGSSTGHQHTAARRRSSSTWPPQLGRDRPRHLPRRRDSSTRGRGCGMIDGDRAWRPTRVSTTTVLFVVHAPGPDRARPIDPVDLDTADYVQWDAGLPAGTYEIQATWLYNVTQRLDDPTVVDVTADGDAGRRRS